MSNYTKGTKRRYPDELRDRAIRMYFEAVEHAGERHGVVGRVAEQLGIGRESLRWITRPRRMRFLPDSDLPGTYRQTDGAFAELARSQVSGRRPSMSTRDSSGVDGFLDASRCPDRPHRGFSQAGTGR